MNIPQNIVQTVLVPVALHTSVKVVKGSDRRVRGFHPMMDTTGMDQRLLQRALDNLAATGLVFVLRCGEYLLTRKGHQFMQELRGEK